MTSFDFAPIRGARLFIFAVLLSIILSSPARSGGTAVDYALCDVRVAFFAHSPAEIDWPTLYYLNDNFGCRIDVILVKQRAKFQIEERSLPDKQLFLHNVYISPKSAIAADDAVRKLFAQRKPDLLLFDMSFDGQAINLWLKPIRELNVSSLSLFDVSRVFRRVKAGSKSKTE
jgi:hypothetical protein